MSACSFAHPTPRLPSSFAAASYGSAAFGSDAGKRFRVYLDLNAIPIPVEPITSLRKLRVLGSAADGSRTQDFAEVIVGYSDIYYVAGQNWFPDLDSQWQIAEFNVFGDSNGDQAVFNAGSTLVVRTEVDSGAAMAPSCDLVGFTGESNNLFLTETRPRWPKDQYPSIVFTETNAAHRKASCATERSRG
jgi:hypothetical protein